MKLPREKTIVGTLLVIKQADWKEKMFFRRKLNIEANRLKTFRNWNVCFIEKNQLALLGFYYYGQSDIVKCFFCGLKLGSWEDGDDVLNDHRRWSPLCSLIRRGETNNVPICEALLDQTLPAAPKPDVTGIYVAEK